MIEMTTYQFCLLMFGVGFIGWKIGLLCALAWVSEKLDDAKKSSEQLRP